MSVISHKNAPWFLCQRMRSFYFFNANFSRTSLSGNLSLYNFQVIKVICSLVPGRFVSLFICMILWGEWIIPPLLILFPPVWEVWFDFFYFFDFCFPLDCFWCKMEILTQIYDIFTYGLFWDSNYLDFGIVVVFNMDYMIYFIFFKFVFSSGLASQLLD